jgi:hypothetical protein
MVKIKLLNEIEGTNLVRVEIEHIVQIKSKSYVEKLLNEGSFDELIKRGRI